MSKQVLPICDFCTQRSLFTINGHAGCGDHIDDAVKAAREDMRAVYEAFGRGDAAST